MDYNFIIYKVIIIFSRFIIALPDKATAGKNKLRVTSKKLKFEVFERSIIIRGILKFGIVR